MKRITESELKARVNKLREYMAEADLQGVKMPSPPPGQMGMPTVDQLEKYPQARPAAPAKPAAPSGYQGSPKAQEIKKLNPDVIKDVNSIGVGKSIKLPDGSTYKIAPGDTLDAIGAGKYKGTPPAAPAAPAPTPQGSIATDTTDPLAANNQPAAPAPTPQGSIATDTTDPLAANNQPAAPAPASAPAPTGIQAQGDEEGNTTITRPDGSTMVVGPNGQQIMPGSNPNLPQNKGVLNTASNWLQNKGEFQKPTGFIPPAGSAPAPAAPAPATGGVVDGSGKPVVSGNGQQVRTGTQESVSFDELQRLVTLVHHR